MTREVHIFENGEQIATFAARSLVESLLKRLAEKQFVNISITGGTLGILTLEKLSSAARFGDIEWNRIHIWWGDERFVEKTSSDRNANQARIAFLNGIQIPDANVHEFPASDEVSDLDEAAVAFNQEVKKFASADGFIHFDITLLGMGPDGHIGSLFPDRPFDFEGVSIVAEHNSPKPPPKRLSFTYQAFNASDEVWFVAGGSDKADPVSVAFSTEPQRLPVGRVAGRSKTVWLLDRLSSSRLNS